MKYVREMFSRNPDGVGAIYDRSEFYKSLYLDEFLDDMPNREFNEIIIHTRKRTRGPIDINNTQPIIGNRYWIILNGGFRGIGGERSDSIAFAEILDRGVSIAEFLRGREGAWSTFILDIKTKMLYYTKNHKRNFQFIIDENNIIGATSQDLLSRIARELNINGEQLIPENQIIYQVNSDSYTLDPVEVISS